MEASTIPPPGDPSAAFVTQAQLDAVSAQAKSDVDAVGKRVDDLAAQVAAAPAPAPAPAPTGDEPVTFTSEVETEEKIVERGTELVRINADGSEEVVGTVSPPA